MKHLLFLFSFLFFFALAPAQTEIILSKSFVNELKDKATIASRFKVLKITPESGVQDDGDLHIYGQDDDIGLSVVAEAVNCDLPQQKPAVKMFRNALKQNATIGLEGAWRIWCEHGQKGVHRQGAVRDPKNIDHVFEIHPVIKADTLDLSKSFMINEKGESYTEATKAFKHYGKLKCKLYESNDSIHIVLGKALYNYARFNIKVPAKVKEGSDCITWYADVLDSTGKAVAKGVRMIAVKGTSCYEKIISLKENVLITVIAEPRVSLEDVMKLVDAAANRSEPAEYALPYEMILSGAAIK